MDSNATPTLASIQAEIDQLQGQRRDIVAAINAVPLRQLTRQNAEYVLLLDKLRGLRERVVQLQLVLHAASCQN